jgi:hypothetical protein
MWQECPWSTTGCWRSGPAPGCCQQAKRYVLVPAPNKPNIGRSDLLLAEQHLTTTPCTLQGSVILIWCFSLAGYMQVFIVTSPETHEAYEAWAKDRWGRLCCAGAGAGAGNGSSGWTHLGLSISNQQISCCQEYTISSGPQPSMPTPAPAWCSVP